MEPRRGRAALSLEQVIGGGAILSQVNDVSTLKMIRNSFLFALFTVACQIQGCGTIAMNISSPDEITKTACFRQCVFLPRIYSGTIIDVCEVMFDFGGHSAVVAFWDLPFSFVADTVILPYTGYMQITEGSFTTEEICRAEEEKKNP